MISLQTNQNSLVAQQNLNVNNTFQSRTIAQLTSGYRINQSGDDAAGLAIANKFRSSIAELTQGVANGNDGVAQLQIMDGGMNNIAQILDRLKTLATQSASGTITDQKTRDTLNSEFQSDLGEIDRQAQSIGLNTSGSFARSLSVYLGAGTGSAGTANSASAALVNSQVTLDLTRSAVDSQSLGLKGMQAVNLTDIGVNSATSVQNIIANAANLAAKSGYASMQFSGAGFSDAGKQSISVNLSGVTDVATLVTAVNGAIQQAGQGSTAAATAFKNANIVASVYTNSATGAQSLAFTSSTSAFQVQAGDQIGNALLGNVTNTGTVNAPIATGAAVTGAATAVTGATTTNGTFAAGTSVNLVITGGGLAAPITLKVNTALAVTTTVAIQDLETQFTASTQLQAAGLSMSGSTVAGAGRLSFNSSNGQSFNVQVTGDSANLLGLGSFLASGVNPDYKTITGGVSYDATAVTAGMTSTGTTAMLEVSLNGQAATALQGIDLTAGTSATAGSLTSTSAIGTNGAVDITAANRNLNITVVNNGVATNKVFSLTASTQVATNGTDISTLTANTVANTISTAGTNHVTLTDLNNKFTVSVNGAAAATVTVATGDYTTATALLGAIQTAIGGVTGLSAGWDAGTGGLVLTSTANTGPASTVKLDDNFATSGAQISGITMGTQNDLTTTSGTTLTLTNANNKFHVSVDHGTAATVTVAAGTYTTATALLDAIQTAIGGVAGLSASWDENGALNLTSSSSTGVASTVTLDDNFGTSASALGTAQAVTDGTNALTTAITVTAASNNEQFSVAVDGHASVSLTVADNTYTTGTALAAAIQNAIDGVETGTNGLQNLQASWDTTAHKVVLTSTTTGVGSSVSITATAGKTGLANLKFGAGETYAQGQAAVSNGALTQLQLNANTAAGSASASNGALTNLGFTGSPVAGKDDAPTTVQSIAAEIQTTLGTGVAKVTVNTNNTINIESLTKGANSSVTINNVGVNSANSTLHFADGATDQGNNISTAEIVSNLNAQFATGVFQAAGLKAYGTDSSGNTATSGNFLTIASNNGTQFRLNSVGSTTAATAASISSTTMSTSTFAAVTVGTNAGNQFNIGFGGSTVTVTVASGTYNDAGSFLTALNNAIHATALGTSTVQASWDADNGGALTLSNANRSAVTVAQTGGNTGLANFGLNSLNTVAGQQGVATENLGFGIAGTSFTASALTTAGANPSSASSLMSTLDANGVSETTQMFTFAAMKYGSDKQAITFSATNSNGALETKTITLENNLNANSNRAGASIDDAVAYINQQLQADTSKPSMQQIMAVKENVGGQEQINFISKLSAFTVGIAATANGVSGTTNGDGLNYGIAINVGSKINGSGSNISIDSQDGAKAAILAISSAVSALGAAQAAVGKGQNQLTYAIGLAQSQITNFSAAESQIRDTNVAQQAANLSKAQTLSQASIAAMAQANSATQGVLALLRG